MNKMKTGSSKFLIVGLGNPGEKFKKTRHNVGFMFLDELRKENDFPDFKIDKKSNSLISESEISNGKIRLVKPQSFMNMSGAVIEKITANYRLQSAKLIVVHDDIDLPLGKIKISKNKNSAGHKGIESIISRLKTKNFTRIRIGIQPEGGKSRQTKGFVVQNFNQKEKKDLKRILKKSLEILTAIIEKGEEKAMNEFNH